ncbi:anti-sigma-I factor RsgI2-like [Cyprinus carpio]|uniref:Anti-sigma-I factor RsgI2-like n=1 Tax=Cyprinus carpio TaxID=7962 RepID=A0A9Q9WU62_CYPCA|nr:anti-sigma-I factor RsgI2-like [Cyprinus carpio]
MGGSGQGTPLAMELGQPWSPASPMLVMASSVISFPTPAPLHNMTTAAELIHKPESTPRMPAMSKSAPKMAILPQTESAPKMAATPEPIMKVTPRSSATMDDMPVYPVIMSVAFRDNKAFHECLRMASSLVDPPLTSVRAAGIPRPLAPAVTEAVPLSTVLPVMGIAIWCVRATYFPPASTESVPEPSPALESVPEPSPALESVPEPSLVLEFAPVPLSWPTISEVADFSAEPPEVAASDCEFSACSAMAKEAVYELSACPVSAPEAVDNLTVLFIPVQPDLPWWFPAPSAPPCWSSAPPWGSSIPSALLWWSSAPPWWFSALLPPPWLPALPNPQALLLYLDLALHPSLCSPSDPPPSWN